MKRSYLINWTFEKVALASTLLVITILLVLFVVLYKESSLSLQTFGIWKFITSTTWNPPLDKFGGAPAIFGSIVSTVIAILIAVPVAIGIAIFLTEISPYFLRTPVGVAIELLAAIPSIIYGMWGLFYFAPFMRDKVQPIIHQTLAKLPLIGEWFAGYTPGIGLLTASIVLSIMILPFTAAIARDSFNMVPPILKESAYALGATKWDVMKDVVIPYTKLGVIGGIILSLGRALGETMAVTFVMGNQPVIPKSLLEPATSITVTLANEFTEADTDLYLSSLFYLALILFVMSFLIIAIGKFIFLRKVER
ncbi:phosphate ABC transporter, inner membrane subunit PstC [Desulfurobacterium thermolithotrophum DSM 11699]|uniref:Phosphate transport system permease protein n=1 Tax=Desulfurobacterium thermolithotrophum (strain DSM 11699 / BSA) TaxID=868864 RepID=F0S0A3_DESTD|nr:phosphate ABC transporter permease subunit PstC [Desulfurobacterium thermolithotrophum]ADY73782.1 phosphate ABC transporter, inner membrane subunit PstC [Desulfurobacterium thermolithotrophum DSM 11699]